MTVFARAGDELTAHPFLLQAQHHDDVGTIKRGIEVVIGRYLQSLDLCRHERGRRTDTDVRPQRGEAMDIRPGDPAVQDVAADRHPEAAEIALGVANGQGIEQSLRWVFMLAVPGVKDRAIDFFRNQSDRPGALVANDHGVGMHRIQGHCRVDQRFALFYAGLGHLHVDHVGAEPLAGDFKRQQRAGGVLEERVDDRQSGEAIGALLRLAIQFDPLFGLVEQKQDLPRSKAGKARQVAVREGGGSGWVAARLQCVRRCH